MWTPTTRKQHIRKTNRYQTDVTDEEWRVIERYYGANATRSESAERLNSVHDTEGQSVRTRRLEAPQGRHDGRDQAA
jgi:hypothetical protein